MNMSRGSALCDQVGDSGFCKEVAVDAAASDLRFGEDDAAAFTDDLCNGEDLIVFCSTYELGGF